MQRELEGLSLYPLSPPDLEHPTNPEHCWELELCLEVLEKFKILSLKQSEAAALCRSGVAGQ